VSLTTDTRRKFVIYVAKRQGQNQNVVSLTNYPHEDFLHTRAFGAPEDNTEDVRFKVHPTTGSVTIVSVPTGAKLPQLMAMVAVLDKATRIEAGMSLGADSEVLSVTGLEFSASLAVTPADTPGASMTMA
jgi:hypothetical protein